MTGYALNKKYMKNFSYIQRLKQIIVNYYTLSA